MKDRTANTRWLGTALAVSAGIHVAVIVEHFSQSAIYGSFFLLLAVSQAFMAARTLVPASRKLLHFVAAANAGVIALWIVSRTVGLPIPPEPWTRETIGIADVASTMLELAIVVLALRAARRPQRSSSPVRARVFAGAVAAAFSAASLTALIPAEAHGHGAGTSRLGALDAGHAHSLRQPGDSDPGPDPSRKAPLAGTSKGLPPGPSAVAADENTVWVTNRNDGTVTALNIATSQTRTFPVGPTPAGIAIWQNQVWISVFGNDTVVRLDMNGSRIGDPIHVGVGPLGIAASPSGIWVTSITEGTVSRIDPRTGKMDAPIPVGFGPTAVVADARDVWVSNTLDRTVVRINAKTHKVVGQPIPVGAGAAGITLAGDSVWVAAATDGTVSRIDRTTGSVRSIIRVDARTLPGQGPTALVAGCGGVWVANNHDKTVIRLDAADGSQSPPRFFNHTVGTYPTPIGIACAAGSLWVSDYDANTLTQIPAEKGQG